VNLAAAAALGAGSVHRVLVLISGVVAPVAEHAINWARLRAAGNGLGKSWGWLSTELRLGDQLAVDRANTAAASGGANS